MQPMAVILVCEYSMELIFNVLQSFPFFVQMQIELKSASNK